MSGTVRRSLRARARSVVCAATSAVCCGIAPAAHTAAPLPTVASINLCADQHVLALADREQILTVSWLAADPEESLFAAEAAALPLNYGTAEELLVLDPDVVIAGTYTSPFTRTLLRQLDYPVVELPPENSVADIERNVRLVAAALGQAARGETAVRALRERMRALATLRPARPPAAVVVRPGGFTVGEHSLANELLALAGLRNVVAEQGLDRWGSLSMEALLRSTPELIVLTGYRSTQPSLANAVLTHPALRQVRATRRTATVPAVLWACGLPRSLEAAEALQRAAVE
jgi:iron complex transport system substrate-binding protein